MIVWERLVLRYLATFKRSMKKPCFKIPLTLYLPIFLCTNLKCYASETSVSGIDARLNRCMQLKFDGSIDDFDDLASSIAANGTNTQNIFNTIASYRSFQASQRYFIPSVSASYAGSYNYNPETGVLAGGSNTSFVNPSYFSNEPSILVNWNFFNLSQVSLVKSQDYAYKSTRYNTASQMLQSIESGINSYISLIQSANLVRTSWMVLSAVKQQVVAITALRKAGQRSLIDEISMKQQYESYRNSYLTNLSAVESNLQSINTLTSQPVCNIPNDLREFQSSYEQLSRKPLNDNIDSVITLLQTNPSYLALLQSEKASFFQGKSAMRTYLPTVSLTANASLTNERGNILGQGPVQAGPQVSNTYTNYIMLSGNWQFYDGGQNYAKAKASFATAQGFSTSAKQTLQSVVQTYKYSVLNDQIFRENIAVAQKSVDDAVKAGSLIEIAYRAGFRTYLDLQTSAQNTFNAMSTKVTADASYAANYFQAQQVLSYPVLPNTSRFITDILKSRPDDQLIDLTQQLNANK